MEDLDSEKHVFFATNRNWDGFVFGTTLKREEHSGKVCFCHVQFTSRTSFLDELSHFIKNVFLFFHGFNNTFDKSVVAAVKYATLLRKHGLVETAFVLLSWPSEGNIEGIGPFFSASSPYKADQVRAQQSGLFFGHLINSLMQRLPSAIIHVVGHSMGALVLWSAFKWVKHKEKLGRVILIGADIQRRLVRKRMGERIGFQVTNYYCRKDRGLMWASVVSDGCKRVGIRTTEKLINIKVPAKMAKSMDSAFHSYDRHVLLVKDTVAQCMTN
jgi:esterase/lipase superfamily enzyme